MESLIDSYDKLAVIGLGYVGLPLAVEFGKKLNTTGYDINRNRIIELNSGIDSTLEVTSDALTSAHFLKFTANTDDLKSCKLFIITVPTPIDSANRPNLSALKQATKLVGDSMKEGSIVIYESTVYPGCTEEICVPILEETSGLRYNIDFFCGYSPERINPGDKINTLTKITKVTSGSNDWVARLIDDLYQSIIEAGTFRATSIKVAEAAKVIENTQRDLNIALVNELSVIFDRLEIDTLEVLSAAESKWNFLPFKPGMVGGHCIGVDPYYLTHKAEMVGYSPQVILAGRRINDNMAKYAANCVIKKMVQNKIDLASAKIGVLGITFKENCPDIRNSKIFDLIEEFRSWGVGIKIHDPWADKDEVKDQLGLELTSFDSLVDLHAIVVAVGHKQFRSLDASVLRGTCNIDSPILGDLKGIYDRSIMQKLGFTVFRL